MIRKIRQILKDESAVSMTEFVVTLPAFIFCFVGVSQLSIILRDGTEAAKFASQDVWKQALSVEQDKDHNRAPQHMKSIMNKGMTLNFATAGVKTGVDAFQYNKESPDPTVTLLKEEAVAFGLTSNADFGEFYTRMGTITLVNEVMDRLPFHGIKIIPKNSPSRQISISGKELYDSEVGRRLFSTGINEFRLGQVAVKSLFSAATGARYGSVVGAVKLEARTHYGKYVASRYATTLVAPTGKQFLDELGPIMFLAVAGIPLGDFVQLPFKTNTQYTEIFGIQMEKKVKQQKQSIPTKFWD